MLYYINDLTNITYIGIHETSSYENSGSRLLKLTNTTNNLGTHNYNSNTHDTHETHGIITSNTLSK